MRQINSDTIDEIIELNQKEYETLCKILHGAYNEFDKIQNSNPYEVEEIEQSLINELFTIVKSCKDEMNKEGKIVVNLGSKADLHHVLFYVWSLPCGIGGVPKDQVKDLCEEYFIISKEYVNRRVDQRKLTFMDKLRGRR